MWKASCKCNPSQFVATPFEMGDDGNLESVEIGVLVNPGGEVTNRWADGTVGVSLEMRELANDEESVSCPLCGKEATWVK